jgi:hypothetical protein
MDGTIERERERKRDNTSRTESLPGTGLGRDDAA